MINLKEGLRLGQVLIKTIRLIIGVILCGSSTVFMLNSNLGLLPWDVFHQGISNITKMTIGQANIAVSFAIILLSLALGEKVGIGTIVNIIVIGKIIDVINYMNIIPVSDNIFTGIVMLIIGMLVMGYGCYLYMGCGLGCGPRDSLMIGLSKKINKPVKMIKTIIEVTALIIGIILGGKFGIGTVISALGVGVFMQIIFKLNNFDAVQIKQKSIIESFYDIKTYIYKEVRI
jgi:uncharacterized protein